MERRERILGVGITFGLLLSCCAIGLVSISVNNGSSERASSVAQRQIRSNSKPADSFKDTLRRFKRVLVRFGRSASRLTSEA